MWVVYCKNGVSLALRLWLSDISVSRICLLALYTKFINFSCIKECMCSGCGGSGGTQHRFILSSFFFGREKTGTVRGRKETPMTLKASLIIRKKKYISRTRIYIWLPSSEWTVFFISLTNSISLSCWLLSNENDCSLSARKKQISSFFFLYNTRSRRPYRSSLFFPDIARELFRLKLNYRKSKKNIRKKLTTVSQSDHLSIYYVIYHTNGTW